MKDSIEPIRTYSQSIRNDNGCIVRLTVFDGDDSIRYETEKFIQQQEESTRKFMILLSGITGLGIFSMLWTLLT